MPLEPGPTNQHNAMIYRFECGQVRLSQHRRELIRCVANDLNTRFTRQNCTTYVHLIVQFWRSGANPASIPQDVQAVEPVIRQSVGDHNYVNIAVPTRRTPRHRAVEDHRRRWWTQRRCHPRRVGLRHSPPLTCSDGHQYVLCGHGRPTNAAMSCSAVMVLATELYS